MSKAIMKETRTSGGGMRNFFSKLSRGLMLPIAMLPIAGMFLGVGAGMVNVIKQAMPTASTDQVTQATFFFQTISSIGDVVFGNLPTLFCLGVAVAFSEEAGVAVFSALVGWLIFNATQSTMIWGNGDGALDYTLANGKEVFQNDTFRILFWAKVPSSVIGANVGLQSMQTSVFGGITVGLFCAWAYNKFHEFQMPTILGFFSGTRFVPIFVFLTVPVIALFFLMVWPVFGILLDKFGKAMAGLPLGINSFIFGAVERSLIPFGLHHAFYTPLWYTSAGGTLTSLVDPINSSGDMMASGDQNIWFAFQTLGIPLALTSNHGHAITSGGSDWTTDLTTNSGLLTIFKDGTKYATLTEGVRPGMYQQGKFSIMMFGLPAAGAAMIMAAKKENRQVAMSVIGAAALTAFLTGITEPIEFTFLFLAPILYYGFHVWMAAISFWLMNILGAHIGMTFSGGVFDFILFGIIPDATGLHANCYWAIVIGIVYIPIYYVVFYFYITKKDVKTPGRDDSGEVKMVSKADYKAAKGIEDAPAAKSGNTGSITVEEAKAAGVNASMIDRLIELEGKLGGLDNLESINACITRLRITVADPSKVDYDGIKAMGSKGTVGEGAKAQQHIFGAEADKFKVALLKIRKARK